MNNHILDTLEIILTQDSGSLGKISSTCKNWHTITADYRDKKKMKYIKTTSFEYQDDVMEELGYEMFQSGTGYYGENYCHLWRDYTDGWEEIWYSYRTYSFFYDEYMQRLSNLNYSILD